MDRTNAEGYVLDGNGNRSRVAVDLAAGIQGTEFDPLYDNNLQEEIVGGLIEAAGLVPNAANMRQLQQAVFRLFGGNFTPLTLNTALTPDQAGLIEVNASGGNVTLTLPLCDSANNIGLRYSFFRTDTTGNTVTIQVSGSDKIYPGVVSSITLSPQQPISLRGDGGTSWRGPGSFTAMGTGGAVVRDVTGSRALGTTYVNTTGRPILVCVNGYSSSASANLTVMSDSHVFSAIGDGGVGVQMFAFAPVEAGGTYSASCSAGTFSLTAWMEF